MSRLRDSGYVPYALLVVFIAMLVVGLMWGEFGETFRNGIIICLHCIGII